VEPGQIKKDLTHPYITDNPENVIKAIEIHDNPYRVSHSTQAIVICTEWDEFVVIIHEKIILFKLPIISIYMYLLDLIIILINRSIFFSAKSIITHN